MGGSRRAQAVAAVDPRDLGLPRRGPHRRHRHLRPRVLGPRPVARGAPAPRAPTRGCGSRSARWLGSGSSTSTLVLFLVGRPVHRASSSTGRDILRTRWPWLGSRGWRCSDLVAEPRLQAANGFPQLEDGPEPSAATPSRTARSSPRSCWSCSPGRCCSRWLDPRAVGASCATPAYGRSGPRGDGVLLAILAVVFALGGKSYYVAGALPRLRRRARSGWTAGLARGSLAGRRLRPRDRGGSLQRWSAPPPPCPSCRRRRSRRPRFPKHLPGERRAGRLAGARRDRSRCGRRPAAGPARAGRHPHRELRRAGRARAPRA